MVRPISFLKQNYMKLTPLIKRVGSLIIFVATVLMAYIACDGYLFNKYSEFSLNGDITTIGNDPIEGAIITVIGDRIRDDKVIAKSDSDGRFILKGVYKGDCSITIQIEHPKYKSEIRILTLSDYRINNPHNYILSPR